MKMIDLHLHLDGSLTAKEILFLANLQKISLTQWDEDAINRQITAPLHCQSLNEYLQCFALTLTVLQSAEALSHAVQSLISRLAAGGMRYVELRFAPQLHMKKGLSQKAATAAAVVGLKAAVQTHKSIQAGLILCFMRGSDNDHLNTQTLDAAEEFLSYGVCAVDLAGAEGLYPTEKYRPLFAKVRAQGIPFTVHAGEAVGPESIRAALSFGTKRVGHGVRCVEDSALVNMLAENGVTLELCPTSNLQTKAVGDISKFPVRELIGSGVPVTINTDNMTVSGTDLEHEFTLLKTKLGLTKEEKNKLMANAVAAAFLPNDQKQTLLKDVFGLSQH